MGRAGVGGRARDPERGARLGPGRRDRRDTRAPEPSALGSSVGSSAEPSAPEPEPDLDETHADDEEWYDTTVLDTIEGIGADDDVVDDDTADDEVIAVGEAPHADDEVDRRRPVAAPRRQSDLFGDDGEDGDDDEEYAEATLVGDDDLDTETAPIDTIDELMGDVEVARARAGSQRRDRRAGDGEDRARRSRRGRGRW